MGDDEIDNGDGADAVGLSSLLVEGESSALLSKVSLVSSVVLTVSEGTASE